jgi:thymidylate synthase ThyX
MRLSKMKEKSVSLKTDITAKVVADSISYQGDVRLTTVEVEFHRFILAEWNTHRAFSRNSASSRAIPTNKLLSRVLFDPAIPVKFNKNQPGMQGGDELSQEDRDKAVYAILKARDAAVECSRTLAELGVHKQVTNRYIEPYMWHKIICTATDWENFFRQRISELAQPEINAAAEAVYEALSGSTPEVLRVGQWHLPYITKEDADKFSLDALKKISAARCARVSYLTHDGVHDPMKDLELYERLATAEPPHASPLEHVATPSSVSVPGNFVGWHQMRHDVLGF